MNSWRTIFCSFIALASLYESSCAAESMQVDSGHLKRLVLTCVDEQAKAGNINVYSNQTKVDNSTLVFANVRYLPDGPEIDVSLDTGSHSVLDGPWAICRFRKENDAISAVTYSLGGKHLEKRIYLPHPTDRMSESEVDAYLARTDWITAKFDLRGFSK